MIDLDANATTALHPEVLDAMLPWLKTHHANPSGSYTGAKQARQAIDRAREQVARLLNAKAEEMVFTSGGTESANAALLSMEQVYGERRGITSAIEHSAVLRCAEQMRNPPLRASVMANGVLDLTDFEIQLDQASWVSVMLANNETGVLQPLAEIVRLAHARGIPVHSDAVQAVGKWPIDVRQLGVDFLSISAHKFHGPKGVGALFVREGIEFRPMLWGGGQESGRRSGTENTASIVGMGAAAELAIRALENAEHIPRLAQMRDAFETFLLEKVSGVQRNGDLVSRLPNTSHLSFSKCDASGMLILLDDLGVACSAGSACMTGKQKPSHVQLAMGISAEQAKTSLRFSFSRLNTLQEAQEAAQRVARAVEKLRRVQGSGIGPVSVYQAP